MYGLKAGGYEFTTVSANTDILPAIKAQETDMVGFRDLSFVPVNIDCHIKINDGTPILCKASISYSNDVNVNGSFTVVESGVEFYMAYNY